MPRRKNPFATFLLFVVVMGFGYAAYHYLYVMRIYESHEVAAVPNAQVDKLKGALEESLSHEEAFDSVASFNWREQSRRFRVDVVLTESATVPLAKRLATRVNDIVVHASDGYPAEVSFLVLGREIYHYVP